jgi:hypothetical protein
MAARQQRHKNQWPIEKLWLALALSAIRRAMAP